MKVLSLILIALIALTAVHVFTATSENKLSSPFKAWKKTNENKMINSFNAWKRAYGKRFTTPESEQYRFAVYVSNADWINAQNEAQSEVVYGENQFMDLTREEFAQTYLGLKSTLTAEDHEETPAANLGDVDWRSKGAVTPVKDQGQCGSCWAFSSTGGMEGAAFVAGKGLTSLSESQLVDCSSAYGNQGCNGGLMDNAFKYVMAFGSASEESYPYKPVKQTCKTFTPVLKISGYTDVPRNSVTGLQTAMTQQPVSVAVDANNWSFYKSGIFSNCGTSLDHGVTGVGFTADYWIVKNSWGTGWGEQGYIRVKMGNTCGIAMQSSWPKV